MGGFPSVRISDLEAAERERKTRPLYERPTEIVASNAVTSVLKEGSVTVPATNQTGAPAELVKIPAGRIARVRIRNYSGGVSSEEVFISIGKNAHVSRSFPLGPNEVFDETFRAGAHEVCISANAPITATSGVEVRILALYLN